MIASLRRSERLFPTQLESSTTENPKVRYDDRLATILNSPAHDAGAQAALWLQLVDLIAQGKGLGGPLVQDQAYKLLSDLRDIVPERRRLSAAASIAGRPLPIRLISFFATDSALVAAPLLLRSQLDGPAWRAVIQDCAPASRALLRERRDLPEEAKRALSAYGLSDFALPPSQQAEAGTDTSPEPDPVTPSPASMAIPIGELSRRIEAYRERKPLQPLPAPTILHAVASFAFETDLDGSIIWLEGVPRGPLIGLSLSEMAHPGGHGVDGRAAGAFRKRDAIRDSRLTVPGHSTAAGDWIMSAQPFFDTISGRFGGYRGMARRMLASAAVEGGPLGAGMTPESVRQLVHELRTPLNAIRGFAEMIEGQYLGEVEATYRKRAETIILESARLLRIFEDLDVAARIAGGEETATAIESDLVRIMRATATHHSGLASTRSVRLQVILPAEPVTALIDEASAVRLIDRLLLCALASAAQGELIKAQLGLAEGAATIEVSRPASLRMIDETTLLDPTFDGGEKGENDDLPLGLAFVLRLIKRMARQINGRFEVGPESFTLILPRVRDSAVETIESN